MSHRRRWWIAGAVLSVAAVLVCLVMVTRAMRPSFHVTGDALPIQLIAVQADGAEAAFDPEGNPLPTPPAAGRTRLSWDQDELQRDFVFEVPAVEAPVLFPPFVGIRTSLHDRALSSSQYGRLSAGSETHVAAIPMEFKRDYSYRPLRYLPFSMTREVDYVDVTLRYYRGPPGPASMRFEGPFAVGRAVAAEDGHPGTLTFSPPTSSRDALRFTFNSDEHLDLDMPVVVYDTAGRRHLADNSGSSSSGPNGTRRSLAVDDLSLEQIAFVQMGEEPRERTFHGVKVDYGRPPRTHAAFLDDVAARLGWPAADAAKVADYQFKSPREAIRVIDLARGPLVWTCWRAIHHGSPRLSPEEMTAPERERVHAAAKAWFDDPATQGTGIMLGLWGRWPEFVDPALDIIGEGGRAAGEVAQMLDRRRSLLTPRHLERITHILKTRHDRHIITSLWNCLAYRGQDAPAQRHILEMAGSDQVWLWWPAIQALRSPRDDAWERLVQQAQADPLMRRRVIQVLGPDALPGIAAEEAAQAAAELPGLFSLDLLRIRPSVLSEIGEAIRRRGDPATATPMIIAFLGDLLANPRATESEGFSSPNDSAVVHCVRLLNEWHEVDIGGVGAKGERVNTMALDWRAVAAEAVRWFKTGHDPAKLPAGWQASPGDVRVIFRSLEAPELSVIGIAEQRQAGAVPWSDMTLVRDFVRYQRQPAAAPNALALHLKTGTIQRTTTSQEFTIRLADLPEQLPIPMTVGGSFRIDTGGTRSLSRRWAGEWEVWVEPVAAQASVLEGTDLLAAWREQYLPGEPLADPLPRTFAQQPRQAVRDLILERRARAPRRPEDGWTPAQLALRQTLNQDPEGWDQDLRAYSTPPPAEEIIAAWERFLERDDLPVEMRVYALVRLGTLHNDVFREAYPQNRGRVDESRRRSLAAFEQAWRADPDLVTREAIRAAVNWSSGASEVAPGARHPRAQVYRWLATRSDEVLRQSVMRPRVMTAPGWLPLGGVIPTDPSGIEDAVRHLKRDIRDRLAMYEDRLTRNLRSNRPHDVQAARRVFEEIKDVAPPQRVAEWQALLQDRPAP